VPNQVPLHWSKDNGDPIPPCEFAPFAAWAFGPTPPGRHLGKCDAQVPMPMRVQRLPIGDGPVETFHVCSSHRGRAVETVAEKTGDYSVV
jgi:hypothetical protein